MTLVIAGHDMKSKENRSAFSRSTQGLFVMSDSTISDKGQTLLSGFKKIYTLPIQVYKPYFIEQTFHSYQTVQLATNCFIAFAGSTITAQHIINGIGNHFRVMRYSYGNSDTLSPGLYKVLMDCESNRLDEKMTEWSEDMFLDRDMEDLLSGDVVANTVYHVLISSLGDAKRHKIDQKGWESLLTQYVLGTYCQVKKSNRLFTFKPRFKYEMDEFDKIVKIVDIEIDQAEILPGELVVLGKMSFEDRAKEAYQAACKATGDVKKKMFDFLNQAIDESLAEGDLSIDRPSVLKFFQQGEMTELDRRR